MGKKIVLVLLVFFLTVFSSNLNSVQAQTIPANSNQNPSNVNVNPPQTPPNIQDYNQVPTQERLIDIQSVNPNIRLDMRYATANNFLKRKLYSAPRCLLRSDAAQRLSKVQKDLEEMGLGLKVYDCYRPLSVTRQMWEILPDNRYVANPAKGSRHNRGAAVDLTLVDNRTGAELEMPTGFDDFTEKAARDYPTTPPQVRRNSELLNYMMKKQGFIPLITEWWHYDAPNWDKYSLLDVPLENIR